MFITNFDGYLTAKISSEGDLITFRIYSFYPGYRTSEELFRSKIPVTPHYVAPFDIPPELKRDIVFSDKFIAAAEYKKVVVFNRNDYQEVLNMEINHRGNTYLIVTS